MYLTIKMIPEKIMSVNICDYVAEKNVKQL